MLTPDYNENSVKELKQESDDIYVLKISLGHCVGKEMGGRARMKVGSLAGNPLLEQVIADADLSCEV